MTPDEVARRCWHAVAFEPALDDGPVGATVLGEDVVVARLGGRLLAAPDRCPHRGARLSGGAVGAAPDGTACLVCPYHALHLDADGAPVHLPARPDGRLPERARVRTLPVEVRHGVVWVCLDADPLGALPDWSAFDVAGRARFQLGPHRWDALASRITENFNDLAHFATVHAATFGDADHAVVPPIELRAGDGVVEHGARMHQLDRVTLDGAHDAAELSYRYTHVMPFASQLELRYGPGRTEWIQVAVTPVTRLDDEAPVSMVLQQDARDFDVDGDLDGWRDFQAEVNEEDRRALEAVRPRRIRPDGADADEVALGPDAFTTAYRRAWRALLG